MSEEYDNILISFKRVHNVVPTLTPLKKENGEVVIDKESLHKLRVHLQSIGVKGVLILGTTGEFLYMPQKQRIECLKAMIDEYFGHFVIFAHATGDSIAETQELLRFLESYEKKVDAAAILPMYYIRGDNIDDEVIRHLRNDFNEFKKIPLVLYNNPSITDDKNEEICNLSPILTAGGGRPFIAGFKYAAHVLGLMEYVLAPQNVHDITDAHKKAIEEALKKKD